MGVPEPVRRGLVQYVCVQSIEIELTERGAGARRRVECRQSLGEFTVVLQGTEALYDRKTSGTNCSPGGMTTWRGRRCGCRTARAGTPVRAPTVASLIR